MTANRIAEIKEEMEQHVEKRAIAKSKIEDILSKLKKDYNIENIEDAKKLIIKLENERSKLKEKADDIESTIEELLEELED